MIKKINFDFFKVNMPEGGGTFETLLDSIFALPGEERTYEGTRYHVRLNALRRNKNGRIIGEAAKIRMTDIPEKMKLNGVTDQIDLDEDQGIGDTAAFVYVPDLQILIYQKNRDAVSASSFCTYVSEIEDNEGDVVFDVILEAEALQRLAEMDIIRRFELQVAAPNNSQLFKELGISPDTLLELMNTSPSISANFTFSMGHKRDGSILKKDVVKLCKKLFGRVHDHGAADEKIKLLVSGKEEIGSETEYIDLFNDRMIETVEIDLGENRVVPHKVLTDAALAAWRKRSKELKVMFKEE
ncbi:DUF6731 family protein [Geopsychrobacter electrodiphilus]|uniref:DUF6731 family protein n=1 Tax=Geopsychrobacter electrodiphilus TaxID=225196 RepID=UPI00035F6780|nr:DUF6731 family protein [Geopsychrobacter electrodiphilus]